MYSRHIACRLSPPLRRPPAEAQGGPTTAAVDFRSSPALLCRRKDVSCAPLGPRSRGRGDGRRRPRFLRAGKRQRVTAELIQGRSCVVGTRKVRASFTTLGRESQRSANDPTAPHSLFGDRSASFCFLLFIRLQLLAYRRSLTDHLHISPGTVCAYFVHSSWHLGIVQLDTRHGGLPAARARSTPDRVLSSRPRLKNATSIHTRGFIRIKHYIHPRFFMLRESPSNSTGKATTQT